MVRRWVCGVVVVAMILGSQGWAAAAMAQRPEDYQNKEFSAAPGGRGDPAPTMKYQRGPVVDSNPNVLLAIPHLPFIPAVLAVVGFNIGAKMKDTGQPASLPWTLDLPVLSLEF